ncbi:response regulator transcription factor [Roseovarius sp. SK2]|uniref:response regulator n=1 Tax=Roseovarius TaxID=74030 RepID=UPI00237C07C3|nr:response regulator transcription factor [Roseovarius sp. SK2]MDD9725910.1 response regulator transcription factor [Roseovarius sp. SK2]
MSNITVAFVDDHPIMLAGICHLFKELGEFSVVASGSASADVVEIAQSIKPDVIVLDLNMPGDVVQAIVKVANNFPETKMVAITASSSKDTAIAALEAGVLGYVLKGSSLDELSEAIRQVQVGETYLSPSVSATVIAGLRQKARSRLVPRVRFSKREEDVLRLLLQGCTNREIAEALTLQEKTVKHYMSVLIQKLNVRNRVEVVLAAQQLHNSGELLGGASQLN